MDEGLSPTSTPDVLSGTRGRLGRIRLNRPRAINALTTDMVRAVRSELARFADAGVDAVWLDGAGERGLCAGGDVRAVRESVLAGGDEATTFFEAEYAMDAAVATSPVPVVAWMDGVVMGGGVGVSVHAGLRLVTERTRLAMPETLIGFFPDVGALWWLARCPGRTGTRLALTGATVGGADAVALGLADRLVASDRAAELVERAAAGERLTDVGLGAAEVSSPVLAEASVLDPLLAGDDAAAILRRLGVGEHPLAAATARELAARSPWAVSVTLAALRRAERMSTLAEVLDQDRRLAPRMAAHPDFAEGVRAQLVDRDRTPRWTHAGLDDVDPAEVEALFP
ncbi:enoyl-CoA hydratase/isomerase family protein [Auraticoccus sp. F435]|uniref:3-hydroxyisobutyryl-CoA hydrolase n=1 Tax=Auraticoccus cholistanensis TaxID=2656650 RepID=A0A6A9UUY7_9ACTN|nr:enoyl-CoA hydratase/isomerase family protein [Auraticoccus cholistanensis]MVA75555.1 enoyl-CoA hydratase/isomerase family protein [Auraticoccus cholistanensis]